MELKPCDACGRMPDVSKSYSRMWITHRCVDFNSGWGSRLEVAKIWNDSNTGRPLDITGLQQQQKKWMDKNFPDAKKYQCLLGVVEEVGELSHAHLKMEQGIRDVSVDDVKDAIGDIVIFLCGYCNTNGYDLWSCVADAWDEVSKRDWRAGREV